MQHKVTSLHGVWRKKMFLIHLLLLSFPLAVMARPAMISYLGQLNGCLCRRLLNLDCPACGLTRSLWNFQHGLWQKSFLLHPMGPAIAVVLFSCLVYFGLALCLGERFGFSWKTENTCYRILDGVVLFGLVVTWAARRFIAS